MRPLSRNLRILHVLRIVLTALLLALAVLSLVMTLMLHVLPMLIMMVLSIGGALMVWLLFAPMLRRMRERLADATRLLRTVRPREATLLFNQAQALDGVLGAVLANDASAAHRAAVFQLSKLEYPRQKRTSVHVYDDPGQHTLLIELGERFITASALEHGDFNRRREQFKTSITVLLFALAILGFGASAWALAQAWRMHQGLECAQAAPSWPRISADMLKTTLIEEHRSDRSGGSRTLWQPRVEYRYRWNGVEYHGSQLGCVERSWPEQAEAEARITSFTPGAQVALRINPERPTQVQLLADDPEWIRRQRTQSLGAALSMATAWLITHLLIAFLLARLNRRKLDEIEQAVWGR